MRPSPKNSGLNPMSFSFLERVTPRPSQTSAPPPLGQILVTCLIHSHTHIDTGLFNNLEHLYTHSIRLFMHKSVSNPNKEPVPTPRLKYHTGTALDHTCSGRPDAGALYRLPQQGLHHVLQVTPDLGGDPVGVGRRWRPLAGRRRRPCRLVVGHRRVVAGVILAVGWKGRGRWSQDG